MSEIDFNWDDLKLFLAVARASGLAGAVVTTGKSAPTLGRRMVTLEAAIGQELFRRLPRGYELTDAGADLLDTALALEAQIAPLKKGDSAGRQVTVKISAGSWMTYALCEQAQRISDSQPTVRLQFISAEAVLDISRRETIIGFRNQRPQQRGLACRKIGQVFFAGYALDPSVKGWIKILGNTPSTNWLAEQEDRHFVAEVTAPRNALDLAETGMGIVLLPTFVGDRSASLQRVTPLIDDLTHDQWIATHQDDRFVPEVRSAIDRLYEVAAQLHRPHEESDR